MATTAKNFRIKQGLVVEGTTGTINGENILTETGSDQYILDLVGGSNLIDSVASGLSVTNSELSIDRTIVDSWYDAAGAAATAQSNAEDYADGLAVNYDAAGAAATAQSNAEDYADGLAVNYDASGSASTAETNAKNYADDLIGDVTVDGTGGNTVTDRIASAVSDLVGTAPAVLDTLQELAAAIGNDVNLVDGIGVAIGNKLPLAGGTMTGNIAMGSNLVTGLSAPSSDNDAARKKYVDDTAATAQSNAEDYADGLAANYDAAGAAATAQSNAEDYADGLAVNYDAAGAAATAQSNAEDYADGLAANYDAAGAAATAQSNAEDYADGLAVNYDAAGAASTAQSNAEGYTDTTVGNILDGDTAFTALNVNNVSGTYAATSTISTAGTATAWSFDSTVFTSAKLLVKFKTATHSQVSEVLLTLDASGNIAITEYAEVGTNGSLGTITAINTAGTINVRVTTAYNATDVMVYATALI